MNDVDELDIIQMAGRAGRSFPPKYIVITPDADAYVQTSLDRLSLALFEDDKQLVGRSKKEIEI